MSRRRRSRLEAHGSGLTFSGVWLADNPLPCPPMLRDGDDCVEKIPLSREAANIGASLKEGLPYQPWAAALARQRADDLGKDDPCARCLPSSPPRMYTLPHYTKLVQARGVLLMLNEFNAAYRQIFTDARPFPDDPQPSWNGYSSARWDGDALVVDTIGFRDDLSLDMRGNPMTSAAKLRERIQRPNFGTLLVDLTLDDAMRSASRTRSRSSGWWGSRMGRLKAPSIF